MKTSNKKYLVFLVLLTSFFSCKDLTELNVNPNGVESGQVNPNLIMPTVLTEAAKAYLNLGYQDIAGVMQHTQKDAWSSGHNDYDWSNQSWGGYYDILRNNDLLYQRSVEAKFEFHQGVALVMRKGELGCTENILPAFDSQEAIYTGILADLEKANSLLSKPKGEYAGIVDNVDVFYNGNPAAWQKFANSLALRYFMPVAATTAESRWPPRW